MPSQQPHAPVATASGVSVPMIPGLLSSQRHFIGRTNFHKGQLMHQMAQGKVPSDLIVPTKASEDPSSAWLNVAEHHRPKAKSNQTQSPASVQEPVAANTTTTQSTKYRKDASQPKWITHDRQVLRFFGYFLEPIVQETHHSQQPQVHQRVRRVVVFFYLSDHTVSISEPRVQNSGIAQGEFMKRTAATTPSGAKFEPHDFNIGGHIKLYGRTIHLVDSDEATRTYYDEALGQPLASPRKYPDDKSSQVDEIDELKQRLRAKAASVAESNTERVRKFHENSQRVLRFFVSWQDPHPLYPETRKYVLHYYLSDDTMEIVEPKVEREGRGHFAVLLSRRRMVSDDKKDRFVSDKDLRCGDFVHVFARRFLLEDCDAFTRDYYLETHGVTQEKHEPEEKLRREKAAKWKLFQVNPRDVLDQLDKQHRVSDGLTLKTTAAEKSHQFYQNDALEKKQLRFRARFFGLKPSDANAQREFVLTFFLEDDTLSVFEPRVKNSGVTGGRFLDRGRFRKCADHIDGDTLSREKDKAKPSYHASDFYVGAVVGFEFAPQQKLELIEADCQTLTYCESHPERFPFSDADAVLKTLMQSITASTRLSVSMVRRDCRLMDADNCGVISVGDVKRMLQRLGLASALNAQQLITLCRRFEDTPSGDGDHGPPPFVYDEFCDALALMNVSPAKEGARDVYERLRKCTGLRRLLREANAQRQRVVSADELARIAAAFKVVMSSNELQEIAAKYAGGRQRGAVDYNALCDRVFGEPGSQRSSHNHVAKPNNSPYADQDAGDDDDQDGYGHYSLRRDGDDAFDGFDDDAGDECVPMPPSRPHHASKSSLLASPRRQVDQQASVPQLPLRGGYATGTGPQSSALVAPRGNIASGSTATDPRVVALLRRVFGDRKYLLRKALRDRDHDKSGFLNEEGFMEAVLAVEQRLSDDDTYLIADVYFPTNNSRVDYTKLLDSAFRS